MPEEKNKLYGILALAVLAALVFGCFAGALAGGVVGFLVAQKEAQAAANRAFQERLGTLPGLLEAPWSERTEPSLPVPLGRQGALVVEVLPGTPAEAAGLQVGDLIVAIDRTPVDNTHPLPEIIGGYKPGDRVTVRFERAGEEQRVQVRLSENPNNPEQGYLGVRFETIDALRFGVPQD